MYAQNKAIKTIPPMTLKNIAIEPNTHAIPRYIGFRENLKIPPVTNFVACSGLKGFTVVWSLLNNRTADIKIKKPSKSKNIPRYKEYVISTAGNNPLEK